MDQSFISAIIFVESGQLYLEIFNSLIFHGKLPAMKTFGILHLFLLLVLLLTYLWSDAQDYVITTKGDSIAGQVKPLLFGVDKKVQVVAQDKKKTVFPIFQVRSYRYRDDIYQPVKGPDGYTFMKLVRPGYLSLYYYQLPNQVTFDGSYLLRRDGKGIDVPNLGFKKAMKNFLSDCPTVVEKLETGELSKKDLNAIIDEYNNYVIQSTEARDQQVAQVQEKEKVISSWDVLEDKVKAQDDFEGKSNALEMISDIKNKIKNSEKIPNFIIEGLKSSLPEDTFKTELENALKEVN